MPTICYEEKRFSATSHAVIDQANEIIEEYLAQGFSLTLRQLYYQFVARGLIMNTTQSYKRLGTIVNDARMAGLIDWAAIEDRTRNLEENSHWKNPEHILEACASQFRVDLWAGQKHRPEVWIEKEALVGVISGVCEELDVPYFACRGYVSQSEQWRAGRRHLNHVDEGQSPIVLHFGDHDPSGIDMTRDNRSRLFTFSEGPVEVRRLALNMDQVEEHNPPPNPAKVTDSRYASYVAQFGEESWELDALEPAMIVQLIRGEVESLRDSLLWDEAVQRQEEMRSQILLVAENWDEVVSGV